MNTVHRAQPRPTLSPSVEALLKGAVDYAGLFPPAKLPMPVAVANFARYRTGPEAWMVGRFVVPLGRLEEFLESSKGHRGSDAKAKDKDRERDHGGEQDNDLDQDNDRDQDDDLVQDDDLGPWELSVLLKGEPDEGSVVAAFNAAHLGSLAITSVEVRYSSFANDTDLADLIRALPEGTEVWVEVDLAADVAEQVSSIKAVGAFAKIRTGGIESALIPPAESVAAFIAVCVDTDVRFKATAGLHHPLRGEYPLTYDDFPPRDTMFGFLNVFLATAVRIAGGSLDEVMAALEETSPTPFLQSDGSIAWRSYRFSAAQLDTLRRSALSSFGSCSVEEPHDELFNLNSDWTPA